MKSLLKLIHLIWLVALLVASVLPMAASAFSPVSAPVSYGGQEQTRNAYAGALLSSFNYDSPSVPIASSEEYRTVGKAGLFDKSVEFLAAEGTPNIVYRALTQADADALAAGEGLTAKAPNGTWTAAQHVANAGPGTGGASMNSPWISTSSRLDVAQAYDSGNGVIAIDLNKVPSLQAQVWQTAPRVNGVQGLPFQRSFWAQETTIYQQIPFNAILGPVK